MKKVEKALAKLYFALGEENGKLPLGSESPGFIVEYFAFRALRQYSCSIANRYFTMGCAAAKRSAGKSPGGKKLLPQKPQPPKGSNPGIGKKKIRQGVGKTAGRKKVFKADSRNSKAHRDYLKNGQAFY